MVVSMQIQVLNDFVDVIIIRKNNKNIYLRFKEDKKLYVTANSFVSEHKIKQLIKDNQKKIEKMYLDVQKKVIDDIYFDYLGKQYIIVYDDSLIKTFFDNNMILVKNKQVLENFERQECLRIFKLEVEKIKINFPDIPDFSLKIRKMKTRWGVCNRGNNTVTLNSELLKKDLDLLDYVIIHELCHFYEANHSAKFWFQVSRFYPNYKEARKRLRS